ncbi:hypothetical protein Ami103574_08550 [Aminipila butyrica]|uniref:Sporulation integral membrane protein YlbJ n=1 Tax=Aminipila butyrica TaxID=433296 RepID=A0A858BVD5_9FIRM|nr:hypothetical protein [Aminipila butyrica]QIB69372.1 hypothetical protein Ami103574_08550 [Aminipila butyrica]
MDIFYGAIRALRSKGRYMMAVLGAGLACLFMVIFPETALLSAQKGIAIWAANILPAMLPFFICVHFMNSIGITRYLNPSCFAFSMSALSGYPMGAKVIGDMGRSGHIPPVECRRLVSFCSTSGPAFMVGSVGASMIGNNISGIIIAVSHLGGALLNGVLVTGLMAVFSEEYRTYKKRDRRNQGKRGEAFSGDYLDAFTNSILSAFRSLGIILAYIILFMMMTDTMQLWGVMDGIHNIYYVGIFKGIFEMTVGCSAISGTMAVTLAQKTIGCSLLISFGGLSILGQSMSMLQGSGVHFSYLLLVKLCHGILAAVLAFVLVQLFL